MPKLIYEVFDPKSRTVTTIDPSNPEIIISLKTWSELTREEKQRVKNTHSNNHSSLSGSPTTEKKTA